MVQTLLETVNKLPESLQQEVLHYAQFLAEKHCKPPVEQVSPQKRGGFGSWKGKIRMADDFDEPLEDFKEYME